MPTIAKLLGHFSRSPFPSVMPEEWKRSDVRAAFRRCGLNDSCFDDVNAMTARQQENWLKRQFNRCWPFLSPALVALGFPQTRREAWSKVVAGDSQFWPGVKSAIVTTINADESGRKTLWWFGAGDENEGISQLAGIRAWALNKAGCFQMRPYHLPDVGSCVADLPNHFAVADSNIGDGKPTTEERH